MQRWIIGGLVGLGLMLVGLVGFYKGIYQPNRPGPMWVPLVLNEGMTDEKRDQMIEEMKKELSADPVLRGVCRDLKLTEKWKFMNEDETVRELRRRLFVRSGMADTPAGKAPAIHVGVTGKVKERQLSGDIATRFIKDVCEIYDLPPVKTP